MRQSTASGLVSRCPPPGGLYDGDDEASRVPGKPTRTHATRSDPGEVAASTASETRRDDLPSNARRRPSHSMHFGAQSRGLRAPCERFAPWVTPGPRITRFRLAADLGRMGLVPHRVSNKVSKITSRHLVPLDRAFPAHALVHRKGTGKEAKLAYLGHVLLDNRQGLVANVCATHATGTAERDAAVLLLEASASPGSTVGADKGYDVARFVADVRVQDVTPHVAQKVRGSAIDGRTTRHAGYHVSQRKRKLVEQVFGWMKTVGGLRKLRHRGIALVDWQLTFAATAYNLVRLRNLEARCP